MKPQIKMIGLDLDGTLLTDKKELLPYTMRVLNEAIARGIYVLAATGRPVTAIPEKILHYPGIRYAVTSNGARVIDLQENKVLIEHLLPYDKGIWALKVLRKYDTMQEAFLDGQGYVEKGQLEKIEHYHRNPNMWTYVKDTRKGVEDILAFAEQKHRDFDKVQGIFGSFEKRESAWKELEQEKGLVLVSSVGYNIEINAAGVDKGASLVALGKLLGIKREEIMACGDGENDAAMLREVGFGVAMANAEESAKAAADYVTLSNEEEGAAKAIEKFALGGGRSC